MTTKRIRCEVCNGRGWDVWYTNPVMPDERLTARRCTHCNGTGAVDVDDPDDVILPEQEYKAMIPFENKSRKLTDSTGDPPPLPAGNSAVETTFQQWMDDHTCDGCPTYEVYNGNPFGEKCAICVRAGQVTDNYGSER
jgi:hypothetical protein